MARESPNGSSEGRQTSTRVDEGRERLARVWTAPTSAVKDRGWPTRVRAAPARVVEGEDATRRASRSAMRWSSGVGQQLDRTSRTAPRRVETAVYSTTPARHRRTSMGSQLIHTCTNKPANICILDQILQRDSRSKANQLDQIGKSICCKEWDT